MIGKDFVERFYDTPMEHVKWFCDARVASRVERWYSKAS